MKEIVFFNKYTCMIYDLQKKDENDILKCVHMHVNKR